MPQKSPLESLTSAADLIYGYASSSKLQFFQKALMEWNTHNYYINLSLSC